MRRIAFAMTGPPVFDMPPGYWLGVLYLALPASVLTFSLYYPVVRKIGPAKAAYSSVLVPIIAMGFSTALEGYRWTPIGDRRSNPRTWRDARRTHARAERRDSARRGLSQSIVFGARVPPRRSTA